MEGLWCRDSRLQADHRGVNLLNKILIGCAAPKSLNRIEQERSSKRNAKTKTTIARLSLRRGNEAPRLHVEQSHRLREQPHVQGQARKASINFTNIPIQMAKPCCQNRHTPSMPFSPGSDSKRSANSPELDVCGSSKKHEHIQIQKTQLTYDANRTCGPGAL